MPSASPPDDDQPPLAPSGVPGFDRVLGGGLRRSGLYLFEGGPGSGKTIMASQIGFATAVAGGSVLCVTLLAESHGKWTDQLRDFGFFDDAVFPERFRVVSGYAAMSTGGLDALLRMLGDEIARRRPALLILEGFQVLNFFAGGELALVQFVHRLNALSSVSGCTSLLLSMDGEDRTRPVHAVVDGIVHFSQFAQGSRRARELAVVKMRHGAPVLGEHVFTLQAPEGVRVYPRIEAVKTQTPDAPEHFDDGQRFGIAGLDAMVPHGLHTGTVTMLLGAPGIVKTLLGLKFLEEGVRLGQPVARFGFYETDARMLAKARGVSIALDDAVADGRCASVWMPPLERTLDELIEDLLKMVVDSGARRLLLDGVEGLLASAHRPDRAPRILTALAFELRARGVTTLMTEEMAVFERSIHSPHVEASSIVDNVLLMRFVEIDSQLRRLISVLKTYGGGHDAALRELVISDAGLAVRGPFSGTEQTMTGLGRSSAASGGDAAPSFVPDPRGQ